MQLDLAVLLTLSLTAAFLLRGARESSRVEGAFLAMGYAAFLALLASGGPA